MEHVNWFAVTIMFIWMLSIIAVVAINQPLILVATVISTLIVVIHSS